MFTTHDWTDIGLVLYVTDAITASNLPRKLQRLPSRLDRTSLDDFVKSVLEYYRQAHAAVLAAEVTEDKEESDELLSALVSPKKVEATLKRTLRFVKEGDKLDLEGERNNAAWYVYTDSLGQLAVSRFLGDYGWVLPREAWTLYCRYGQEMVDALGGVGAIELQKFDHLTVNGVDMRDIPQYRETYRDAPSNLVLQFDGHTDRLVITDEVAGLHQAEVYGKLM